MSVQNIEQSTCVSARLRVLRRGYGLSQRELARRSNVTNATISQVEQGVVSPTVASLEKIAGGLGMTLAEFFSYDIEQGPIFFCADELHEIGRDGVSLRLVPAGNPRRALRVLHEVYAPGADAAAERSQHEGEECGVVVRGQITITVGTETHVLGPGDAYYFPSRLPHRVRNDGDEPAELVSATTPPTFEISND